MPRISAPVIDITPNPDAAQVGALPPRMESAEYRRWQAQYGRFGN
jgi:hypothetical protein